MRLGFTTSNQSQREHQWNGSISPQKVEVGWHHSIDVQISAISPCSKKFKSQQSAEKVMVIVFWDSVGVILVDFMFVPPLVVSLYGNYVSCILTN